MNLNPFLSMLNHAKYLVTKKFQSGSTFNSFMCLRILSMDDESLQCISDIQPRMKYLSEKQQEQLLFHVLPKQNSFYVRYISKKKIKK